ncbi:MAG: phage integrase SAM-like domain-containing protein [Bacteroidia bacterium]|jgi:integrase/recombinase XerD|nr:site-specific integrase [Saprospiraceae bacterium]MBV6474144.1 Tyrosine recombinase XerC [Saprospiraceae bacterium]
MASVKVVLRKKPNSEAKLPLCIQIVKDRRNSVYYIGQYLNPNDWDADKQRVKKSHPNHRELNNLILKKLTEANKKLLEIETQRETASSKAIRNNIKSKSTNKFFSQANIYLENLKLSGKYNRYTADKPRITRFKEFLNGDDISFEEITVTLLNKFKAYLKGTRKISDRTIVNHLIVIRSVFSQAIKDNLIESKYYPFGKDKVQIKFPDSLKVGLSEEEVKILENTQLEKSPSLDHARNLWLVSFYFAGIRVSDILRLKWSDFPNGRLHYSMGKNSKAGSLMIPEKATLILEQYQKARDKTDLVFPYLKNTENFTDSFDLQRKIKNATKTIDEALQKVASIGGINKKLTMHIARHTFGNLSGDKIPIQMLQKLYRHTSITTTIGYQSNFVHKDTDEALNVVLNY